MLSLRCLNDGERHSKRPQKLARGSEQTEKKEQSSSQTCRSFLSDVLVVMPLRSSDHVKTAQNLTSGSTKLSGWLFCISHWFFRCFPLHRRMSPDQSLRLDDGSDSTDCLPKPTTSLGAQVDLTWKGRCTTTSPHYDTSLLLEIQ